MTALFNENMRLRTFATMGIVGLVLAGTGCMGLAETDADSVLSVEEAELSGSWRSTLKMGNFTFSIPEGAAAVQTDSGGKSAISVYVDEASVYQADGIIYSILFSLSSEFETGESYSFEEWLKRQNLTLTGHTSEIGGLKFYEGHGGSTDSVSYYHYFAETADESAYVVIVPAVRPGDSAGEYIQNTLNFSPTAEELEKAQPVR